MSNCQVYVVPQPVRSSMLEALFTPSSLELRGPKVFSLSIFFLTHIQRNRVKETFYYIQQNVMFLCVLQREGGGSEFILLFKSRKQFSIMQN